MTSSRRATRWRSEQEVGQPIDDTTTVLDALRSAANHEPFTPYTIVMTSGDRYRISWKIGAALNENESAVLIYPRSGWHILRVNQIVAIEFEEQAAA